LTTMLIGAGGWAYFRVPEEDALTAYTKAFNFVEVNSSFYEYPDMRTVRSWRRRAPRDFEFSVRCHRDITHQNRHNEMTRKVRDLFGSVDLNQVRIAFEMPRANAEAPNKSMINVMEDLNMVHCVDLSREEPAYKSDLLYTRLFGHGEGNVYQFTDEELREINAKASRPEFERSILAFHGVKMYKDAARLKAFRSTGSFPSVTSSLGLESLREVLSEDQSFPASKTTLIERQGWKIVDLTLDRRVTATTMLAKLPDRQYLSVDEVLEALVV